MISYDPVDFLRLDVISADFLRAFAPSITLSASDTIFVAPLTPRVISPIPVTPGIRSIISPANPVPRIYRITNNFNNTCAQRKYIKKCIKKVTCRIDVNNRIVTTINDWIMIEKNTFLPKNFIYIDESLPIKIIIAVLQIT